MSTKRKIYSAEFKAKLVLEVLAGEKTLNEIASKYEVLPNNVKNWKKQFLENVSLAFDKSAVVKEYKEELETLQKEKDLIAKKLGETIVEKEFLEGKLVSLVSSKERQMMLDIEHKISQNRQCKLLNINKSSLYHKVIKPYSKEGDLKMLDAINNIYSDFPSYGYRRVHSQLKREGYTAGKKLVKKAMRFLGLNALYSKPKTTIL